MKSEESLKTIPSVNSDDFSSLDDILKGRMAQKNTEKLSEIKPNIKLTPFDLRWCYGQNNQIPSINLTTLNKKIIFYTAAHVGILYDYETKNMRLLQGHQNPICSIAADEVGRWVVTADQGDDNAVIVWDAVTDTPIFTVFNPHKNFAIQIVGFSKNGKYLITIGTETQPIVKFWLWTLGNDQSNAQHKLETKFGSAKCIKFNPNCYEHFLIAFEQIVIFGIWIESKMSIHVPKFQLKDKGRITDATYVIKSHNVFSSTTSGNVIVWGNTVYNCRYEEYSPLDNYKEYIKSVKLSEYCIDCINENNGIICTGDANGKIQFYDLELKILYWIQTHNFDPIKSISFNLSQSKTIKIASSNAKCTSSVLIDESETETESKHSIDEQTENKEIMVKVPSDATLNKRPFYMTDFLIFTKTGFTIMYHFLSDTYEYLIDTLEKPIKAIAAHPEKNLVIFGNKAGQIAAYNVNTHQLINNHNLQSQIQESESAKKRNLYNITALTFSTKGLFLACGTESGAVWMLNPNVFHILTKKPLKETSHSIQRICFSSNLKQMAFYDSSCNVFLYSYDHEQRKWHFNGKIHSHYKPIRELLFLMEHQSDLFPRMFTIAEDRMLVEYDVENSVKESKLIIRTSQRIEQSAIPLHAVWLPMKTNTSMYETYLLGVDNQFKFKLYNCNTGITVGTKLACTFGKKPIQKLLFVEDTSNDFLIYATKNVIGLQGLPLDGNPYKYVGVIGHPIEIFGMCLSSDLKYLFTVGRNDTCVMQWHINIRSISIMMRLGGTGLNPYFCLLDGGENGYLFKELKNLFYYMQILHQGENTPELRIVSNKISIFQLSDLMRACGFFPTEYEIENMIVEVKHNSNKSPNEVTEIEFEDFVKLYINHKPVNGITINDLAKAFEHFTSKNDRHDLQQALTRQEFVNILCSYGEKLSLKAIQKTLSILCDFGNDKFCAECDSDSVGSESEVDIECIVPELINFKIFKENILGIDENQNGKIGWPRRTSKDKMLDEKRDEKT